MSKKKNMWYVLLNSSSQIFYKLHKYSQDKTGNQFLQEKHNAI